MKPHKHAELIKAWADGAEIEVKRGDDTWISVEPAWSVNLEYRIKPEEKKPVVRWLWAYLVCGDEWWVYKRFMTEDEAARFFISHRYKRLDWSRTEFEE